MGADLMTPDHGLMIDASPDGGDAGRELGRSRGARVGNDVRVGDAATYGCEWDVACSGASIGSLHLVVQR